MLGHVLHGYLGRQGDRYEVLGTVRSAGPPHADPSGGASFARLVGGGDANNLERIRGIVAAFRPHVVINCVGIVKQLAEAKQHVPSIYVNALFPHLVNQVCEEVGARLIHFSTDCVFSGKKGNYVETDIADADDLYGRSKLLGDVTGRGALTLRTSIIGHEIGTRHGLVEWFLSQKVSVQGYTKALFSGLPTVEIARVLDVYILGSPEIEGLYNISASPISKYHLLRLVGQEYGVTTEIRATDAVVTDRTLDSTRFRAATGYRPPHWTDLVRAMRDQERSR